MQLFYFSNNGAFENVFEPKRSNSFYANSWENQQKSDCMKMQRGGFKISKRRNVYFKIPTTTYEQIIPRN